VAALVQGSGPTALTYGTLWDSGKSGEGREGYNGEPISNAF